MSRIQTVCPFCGCGCSLYLVVRDGLVAGVEPSPTSPVNKGMLCAKGWNAHAFVHSPDRLTVPLVRKNGTLTESGWDEALDLVSSRLAEIAGASGPEALGFLCSAKASNEENYLLMKLARQAFKTNNVDHCARL